MTPKTRFKVIAAVYVIMMRDNKILLSRRCNTGFCDGQYGLPSGHVEEGESVQQALIRETKEEIGITLQATQFTLAHVRSRNAGDGHRLDSFFVCREWNGEPVNLEPEKCDQLSWFDKDDLPSSIIPYIKEVLEHIQQAELYSEEGWA